jgi:hypothetical protein
VAIALVFIAVGVALAASLLSVHRRPDGDDRRRAADAPIRLNGERVRYRRTPMRGAIRHERRRPHTSGGIDP